MKFKIINQKSSNSISETYKLYTNGVKTIRVYDGETPPDGFYPG